MKNPSLFHKYRTVSQGNSILFESTRKKVDSVGTGIGTTGIFFLIILNTSSVLTLGAERLCRRAGAGEGTPVGPPAGLERLPSLQVEEAGEGGGGMLAASSSRPRCFSRGNSGIFGFFGGWIILNLEEESQCVCVCVCMIYLPTSIESTGID